MRHQLVVLHGEIDTPIEISSIEWVRHTSGDAAVHLKNFNIYMGYCSSDELGKDFEANYISGSKKLVYSSPDVWIKANGPGEWFNLELTNSFNYNGQDNLIIDFVWEWGEEEIYVYAWDSGANRMVYGGASSSTGNLDKKVLHMKLTGTIGLHSSTFAEIKAMFND